MAQNSHIEWTDATWNPVTGCTKISIGCQNCYAERLAKRLQAMGNPRYSEGFKLRIHEDLIDLPSRWKKPKMVFVNSMSDLFHEDIPEQFINDVFNTMKNNYHHIFQVLTKRSNRLQIIPPKLWDDNIWMGITIEAEEYLFRVEELRQTGARTRFISFEPLLDRIPEFNMSGIDWVIVGGETGPNARPMKKEWAIEIRNRCIEQNIPFFFKQWGGIRSKQEGRILEGEVWEQYPMREGRLL